MTTPNIDAAVGHIQTAQQELDAALAALTGTVPPVDERIHVTVGTPVQSIIDSAPVGAVLAFDVGDYPGPIRVPQCLGLEPWLPVPEGRATAAGTGVRFIGTANEDTITITGDGVTLCGITAVCINSQRQPIAWTGHHLTLDRCTLRGDEHVGCHRGLLINGAGASITGCHIDRCFDVGRDTQAICGWDGTRDIVIDDCYLEGAGETVLFGGADSQSEERMPRNIQITNSVLTKDPTWYSRGVQCKNALELKACVGFEMHDCTLEYGGIAEGQGGYVILFSVRNQDGKAPWSTVRHVRVTRCRVQKGGSGIKFSGEDDTHPGQSVPMDDVVLDNVLITDIDPEHVSGGDARGVLFVNSPDGVTLENITLEGQHLGTTLYMLKPYSSRLTLKNIKLCPSAYGMKIEGGGSGPAEWQKYMPDAVIQMTPADTGASDYPPA